MRLHEKIYNGYCATLREIEISADKITSIETDSVSTLVFVETEPGRETGIRVFESESYVLEEKLRELEMFRYRKPKIYNTYEEMHNENK